jgi:hypothetical protein
MPPSNCSEVKSALTDLREIIGRSHKGGRHALETAKIIANLEATISSIEEKSLAEEDIPLDHGLPYISGITAPVV